MRRVSQRRVARRRTRVWVHRRRVPSSLGAVSTCRLRADTAERVSLARRRGPPPFFYGRRRRPPAQDAPRHDSEGPRGGDDRGARGGSAATGAPSAVELPRHRGPSSIRGCVTTAPLRNLDAARFEGPKTRAVTFQGMSSLWLIGREDVLVRPSGDNPGVLGLSGPAALPDLLAAHHMDWICIQPSMAGASWMATAILSGHPGGASQRRPVGAPLLWTSVTTATIHAAAAQLGGATRRSDGRGGGAGPCTPGCWLGGRP